LARQRAGRREAVTVWVGRYPYGRQWLRVPSGWVSLAPEDRARVARESAEIKPLWTRESPPLFSLPLGPPLAEMPPPERFGARRYFNRTPRSPHSGADYPAPAGTPVLAAADGVVALVADHFFAGNSVYVDHGGGLISMCFHLARVDVQVGEVVKKGQVLGLVGATGRALGPHLHFGLRWHGARIDPALLLGPLEDLPEIGR
jgi:murein DD-endopeptidase MepM/ murein hydrolase activator NlpD